MSLNDKLINVLTTKERSQIDRIISGFEEARSYGSVIIEISFQEGKKSVTVVSQRQTFK